MGKDSNTEVDSHADTSDKDSNTEVDSHADISDLGKNALMFLNDEQQVNVVGYDRSKGTCAINLPIVSGTLVYNDLMMGMMLMLVIHQAVHVQTMNNNLLWLMQVWMNDIKLNDTPKFLIENPTNTSHAITATVGEGNDIVIPSHSRA